MSSFGEVVEELLKHSSDAPSGFPESRRIVDRTRRVSKTNLSVALLNLLYGGVDYLEAALDTVAGEAQLSALARVQETVRRWDFSADAAAAEELAGQPIVCYSLCEELAAAVDTDLALVKLPREVGRGGKLLA